MGFVRVTVELSNPADETKKEQLELLADTGAMLSVLPRPVLERLGLRPTGRRRFRGFAAEAERDTGGACMRYDGQTAVVPVVFGEPGDPALMGATALEALGYEVDPVSGQLKPTEMLILFSLPVG